MKISGIQSDSEIYTLDNINTVNELDLPRQSMNVKYLPDKYRGFRSLPIEYKNAQPRILLGLGHSGYGFSAIAEENDGLIVKKTKLGWTIHGSLKSKDLNRNEKYSQVCLHLNSCDEDLETLVREYFNSEDLGTNLTFEDNENTSRAASLLNSTTRKLDENKYETGLLWKQDETKLPNNFASAYNRLLSIENRMKKDLVFAEKYKQNLMACVEKGYARLLSSWKEMVFAPFRRI